jgi:tetratricopeptide (TPR) repeat protein
MRFLSILGISLLLCAAGQAQISGRDSFDSVDLRGQVVGGGLAYYGNLTVQMRRGNGPVRTASVYGNGQFSLRQLPEGEYTASLLDWSGDVLWEDMISVTGGRPDLTIRLPEKKSAAPASPGTVSVHALEHKTPKAAQKEYRSGCKAFDEADYQKAAKHFRKALDVDPAFVSAYNNLAATYSKMGRHQDALDELKKAHEIDPDSVAVNLNLGAALLRANDFAGAEEASRRALALNPGLQQADVILGLSLKAQSRDDSEALFYLLRGADQYPEARLSAAEILADTGKRDQALDQLKKYLATNLNPERREQVEQWIAKLQ